MEIQGTQKTQSNFEKQQSWRTYTSQFQNCPKPQSLRQCGWYSHKRSMESRWESKNKPYMITNFQKGCQDNLTEKKSFQKLALEKLGIHMQKNEVGSSYFQFSSVRSLSRVQLCDPMNCSTPGLLVHHQLPEFMQTHVHRVGDAIQPSHPLSSPSPPAPNPSQHERPSWDQLKP